MKNNVEIRDVCFEVTRRCNLRCKHCLRGKCQSVTMSDEIIRKAINDLSGLFISSVVITGGEPTLVPNKIGKILLSELEYDSFYLVTNGVRYSPSTAKILNEAYNRVVISPHCDFIGGLSVSRDQFHPKNNSVYYRWMDSCEEFFLNDRETPIPEKGIINEGLAKENKIGQRNLDDRNWIEDYYDGEYIFNTVYINALGDVVLGCDYSYSSQEKFKIGNIKEKNLLEILDDFVENYKKEEDGVA